MAALNQMLDYWYVWPIGIALWLGLGWLEFGYFEAKAISSSDPRKPTLSYFVYYVSTKFPLAAVFGAALIASFFSVLATHFFWHWCPQGSFSFG